MTVHRSSEWQDGRGMSGQTHDGAPYSAVGSDPNMSRPPEPSGQGAVSGHSHDGAPYRAVGHGPGSTTAREAEAFRQSHLAAHEALQSDAVGNALAAAPFAVGTALGAGASLAGALAEAAFDIAKTAAEEGMTYTFTHMDDPLPHSAEARDGGAPDAGSGPPRSETGTPGDQYPDRDTAPQMSVDPQMSIDPLMSTDSHPGDTQGAVTDAPAHNDYHHY
ncbi:hypothetical protein ACFY04_19330 [Streptomyces sp. NPDC001549]|uniref:hypothetical protein n=1 Tax=Streptomyces sp. NPDC001549 TaxID=3364586 RepID=UPI0036CF014F